MKAKYIFGTLVCSAMALGFTSCDNDEFLNVTQYNVIEMAAMYENDANAKTGLNGVYDMMYPNGSYNGDWGFKPNLFTGCHPTIDTQATGWDKDWNVQKWNASSGELLNGWKHVYAAICRANDYLTGLEASEKVSAPVKAKLEGEGRALRGFFYHWLGSTFGRVPMLATGENFSNTPQKARAETYAEMWDFVIEDFKAAAELLDWEPLDGQYGRATKGMALAYLADAYMWKAYRLTDGDNGMGKDEATAKQCYEQAKTALKQILDSGTYELNRSFTTNWDPASAWGKEAIWVEQLDEGGNWSSWGDLTSNINLKWYVACPEGNGGWGSLYLSWEWYDSYEHGDKRRDGSAVTGAVNDAAEYKAKYEELKSIYNSSDENSPIYEKSNPYYFAKDFDASMSYDIVDKNSPCYGVHPYLQEKVGNSTVYWEQKDFDDYKKSADYKAEYDPAKYFKPGDVKSIPSKTVMYHFYNGEYAPSIWSLKLWRTASAQYNSWGAGMWSSAAIYWKRLPNVMLDYAECRFILYGENDAEGWKQINALRERAFGKLEDGHEAELTAKYLPFYNGFATFINGMGNANAVQLTEYPIPFGSYVDEVADAKTYYTALASEKGFTSPVWKVAVNEERRKEFNCEWCLRPDMHRSNYMEDHVKTNYPKRNEADLTNIPWTNRDYDYNGLKMDMPIPEDELNKNPLCDQNPAYAGKE